MSDKARLSRNCLHCGQPSVRDYCSWDCYDMDGNEPDGPDRHEPERIAQHPGEPGYEQQLAEIIHWDPASPNHWTKHIGLES